MTSQQPKWKLVANLGDVNPIDHGGLFVYVDETGVYAPEMEKVDPIEDYDDGNEKWEVNRVTLDRCSYFGGVLSDNKYHPSYSAWFGHRDADRHQDSDITGVADYVGTDLVVLIGLLCSSDPIDLANGYRAVLDCHGWDNGDGYPLEFTDRGEIEARYAV